VVLHHWSNHVIPVLLVCTRLGSLERYDGSVVVRVVLNTHTHYAASSIPLQVAAGLMQKHKPC
jgi:hypothetical protein